MGMFPHDAILITTDREHASLIARFCDDIDLTAVKDKPRLSGLTTLLIPPHGGKKDGDTDELQNMLRKQLIEFLRSEKNFWLSWVRVTYGDLGTYIVDESEA